MISAQRAYELILRCIKAIAGRGESLPSADNKIERLGITTSEEVKRFRSLVTSEVNSEGYEFAKMSLESIQPSSTIDDLVQLVTHATPKSHPRMY